MLLYSALDSVLGPGRGPCKYSDAQVSQQSEYYRVFRIIVIVPYALNYLLIYRLINGSLVSGLEA